MATHSSVLVWKIPWIEEPVGLQSMELQSQARLGPHIDTALIIDFILHTHLSNNFILNSRFSFKDILEVQKKSSFYIYLLGTVSGALHIFVQIQISIRYHFLSA